MPESLPIRTQYRSIVSAIPHPDSLPLLKELERIEPRSMGGFPPVVWDRAEGFQVYDAYGNKWIDFSSSVVMANAGHANPRIGAAIRRQLDAGLWHCYCNPNASRLQMLTVLRGILPSYLDKVFLLTTGAEAVECALKLARLHGRRISPEKIHIVSHVNAFHGRTMGAQMAGGAMEQQAWMGQKPAGFHHIPFPECWRCPWGKARYADCGPECWSRSLALLHEKGINDDEIAGVIVETFPGPTVSFMPIDYALALREWSRQHQALLVFDDIQAGFGRTGRWFGFEHYGVEPDLVCMSKGMSSSLPISAVAGRADILDLADPGAMSSTHTGNPLCCAAAIANIAAIREGGLMENAAALEQDVLQMLPALQRQHPDFIRAINGKGLVWAVCLSRPGAADLAIDLAQRITTYCLQNGVLMLQTNRGTLKIAPPLCISREALREGIRVIVDAVEKEIVKENKTR